MTNTIFRLLLCVLTFTYVGCTSTEPINLRSFPIRNIPEHDFKISISKLHDTIASMFSVENQIDNKILGSIFFYYYPENTRHVMFFNTETKNQAVFSKEYFSKSNRSDDIYLSTFDFWPSKLYFSGKHQLEYTTPFIIKLTKIDTFSTKVNIVAENPIVVNGISGYGAHGAVARETPVEPTSIEEYNILLFIASKLGDSSMLPIKLPVID